MCWELEHLLIWVPLVPAILMYLFLLLFLMLPHPDASLHFPFIQHLAFLLQISISQLSLVYSQGLPELKSISIGLKTLGELLIFLY